MSDPQQKTLESETGFDRFISGFATQNLESRVRKVFFFLLLILLSTSALAAFLLTRTFEISVRGVPDRVSESKKEIMVSLGKNYLNFIPESPEFHVGLVPDRLEPVIYDSVSKQGSVMEKDNISLIFHTQSPLSDPRYYRLILQRKSYLRLLLEKAQGEAEEE